jgi:hypothetical protein
MAGKAQKKRRIVGSPENHLWNETLANTPVFPP